MQNQFGLEYYIQPSQRLSGHSISNSSGVGTVKVALHVAGVPHASVAT